MCDKIISENIPQSEIPKYVYKVVQKVGNGKYVTPVMGETLYKGTWKKAPKIKVDENQNMRDLIILITTKYAKKYWVCSSLWDRNHLGRWGSFKSIGSAKGASLTNNFMDSNGETYPALVVKCEIRGKVHESSYKWHPTYLSEQIRVVEECAYID